MLAKVNSCALFGLEATLVEVEVDSAGGQPAITLVGLPSVSVKEAKDRVWSAIRNCGLKFPFGRLTINLAPADLRKEGPSYDLAIALGVLAATGQIPPDSLDRALVLGEISLDGNVRHARGVIAAAALARSLQLERIFVPTEDAPEAALIPDVEVIPVDHLISLVEHLLGLDSIPPYETDIADAPNSTLSAIPDFADIKGQEFSLQSWLGASIHPPPLSL